jgi:hypothetical protein
MQLNKGNKNGKSKYEWGNVNAVKTKFRSYKNHFVNKVDQVLLPNQFYMKQNFAFHLYAYVTSTLIGIVPIITISYSSLGFRSEQ